MAFRFFRRRQKMVIIIMAALMVSFLIGIQGFNMLFSHDPAKRAIGRIADGEVIWADLDSANSDLQILGSYVSLEWASASFRQVLANGDDAALAYALLLKEARKSEAVVTEADVDRFFIRIGLEGDAYDRLILEIRSRRGMTEKRLRGAVARWLKVEKIFRQAVALYPPSEVQLRHLYRDLNENIALRVVKLPAEAFLDKVPEPSGQEIASHFAKLRLILPDRYPTEASFGFGYFQPARIRISYLLVRTEPIERVTRVDDEAVRGHFLRHEERYRSQYIKDVSAETAPATAPATTPASAPATQVATQAADEKAVFTWARPKIIAELTSGAVRAKVEKLLGRVDRLLEERSRRGEAAGADAYEQAAREMTAPADEALARRIDSLFIKNEPLERAVEILAKEAGLSAICYPWGAYGQITLAPSVRVTVVAKGITVARALEEITAQVFAAVRQRPAPKFQWAMCEGFDGVLFPLDGEGSVKLFPLFAKTTPLIKQGELADDEVLRESYSLSKGGLSLQGIAFSPQVLGGEVPFQGRRMYVRGSAGGRLLWRVVEAAPAHAPKSLVDAEGLQEQVVKDLKTAAAFALAQGRAAELKTAAERVDLEAAAEEAGFESYKTSLFPRLKVVRRFLTWRGMIVGVVEDIVVSVVEALALPTPALREKLLARVFKLVPEDIEPPYTAAPSAVKVVPLPALRLVAVIQRADYRPAVQSEYEASRAQLADLLKFRRLMRARVAWFSYSGIKERLGFELEKR